VRWALVGFASLAAIVVLIVLVRMGDRFTLVTVALALILGGALGNLHDRILYGSVVDFIEVHIFSYHWPDFNVADSAVVTGACLLLLDSLLPKKRLTP
jgi:signal peptidase II